MNTHNNKKTQRETNNLMRKVRHTCDARERGFTTSEPLGIPWNLMEGATSPGHQGEGTTLNHWHLGSPWCCAAWLPPDQLPKWLCPKVTPFGLNNCSRSQVRRALLQLPWSKLANPLPLYTNYKRHPRESTHFLGRSIFFVGRVPGSMPEVKPRGCILT